MPRDAGDTRIHGFAMLEEGRFQIMEYICSVETPTAITMLSRGAIRKSNCSYFIEARALTKRKVVWYMMMSAIPL